MYDRFVLVFSILFVLHKDIKSNKLNSNNFITYFERIIILLLADIIFDWIKDILIYKYSGFDNKTLKLVSFELAVFHEKLRKNSFQINGVAKSSFDLYANILEKTSLTIVDKSQYWMYNNILDYDVITCMELENNVIIYCVFVLISH